MSSSSARSSKHIVIATRESALALWQAQHVRESLLRLDPGLEVELLGMTTQGDRLLDASLATLGGKGLFVKELEQSLSEARADIAVHSMKDVPMSLPSGFVIAAILEREDPRDAFVSNRYATLAELPVGSVIGTSSLRRESQLRARYPQLLVQPLRGNVQTRLRKLDEDRYAGIILAAAGLKRLGLEGRIRAMIEPAHSLPAPGQGALGIECLMQRDDLLRLLALLNHTETAWCVSAERAVSRALSGSCTVPLGAYAELEEGKAVLRGFVASPDGSRMVRAQVEAESARFAEGIAAAETLGCTLAERLNAQGAAELLAALEHE